MSRTCINCGQELADEDKYCPLCGTFNKPEEQQNTNQYYGTPYKPEYNKAQYDPYEAGMVHQAIEEKKTHNKAWIILTLGVIAVMAIYQFSARAIELKKADVPAAQYNPVVCEVGQIIDTGDFELVVKEAVCVKNEQVSSLLPEGRKLVAVKMAASDLKDEDIFEERPEIYGVYDDDHYVESITDYEVIDILEKIGYKEMYFRDLKYKENPSGYLFYVVDDKVKEITLAYSEREINAMKGNTIGSTYEVTVPIEE